MIMCVCNSAQLPMIEDILFTYENNHKPSFSSFEILCDGMTYYYGIDFVLGKYRIITL